MNNIFCWDSNRGYAIGGISLHVSYSSSDIDNLPNGKLNNFEVAFRARYFWANSSKVSMANVSIFR